MIVEQLLNPKSIVVVGASNEYSKPGGKVLKNLLDAGFDGELFAVNPKLDEVQGVKCHRTLDGIKKVDLAIIAVAAHFAEQTVEILAREKDCKAFIILSAGFSEVGEEGSKLENRIVEIIDEAGGSLIGPNCIGALTPTYAGVFAGPAPKLDPEGLDFVSGSGATAVFILETAIQLGIKFSSLFSVGNSAQIGVEEVLEYWDESFDPENSSKVKIIYIEQISKPDKLLKHARSLIRKGCKIAAVKAGTTDAGARAVSSHTGALAGSDLPVDALFRKAGIIRCHGRQHLAYAAGALMNKPLKGRNLAIVTHAGGPGVMMTDAISKGGLAAPHLEGYDAEELLSKLFYGSSVANPIDFLATGTAEQLVEILEYVENKFDKIDAAAVIFGTPGLFDVTGVYEALYEKMQTMKKPVYPVLPSLIQAKDAIERFKELGGIYFPDEVILGETLCKIYETLPPFEDFQLPEIDNNAIRSIVDVAEDGYLPPEQVQKLLDAAGVNRVKEFVVRDADKAVAAAREIGSPVAMKVVGPVHKSDLGGVKLNIEGDENVRATFEEIMKINGAEAALLQPMLSGTELFAGAKREEPFGSLILCGLGGIFIEALKDFAFGLSPIGREEAMNMIQSLSSFPMMMGMRGADGFNAEKFVDVIVRLSALLEAAPEIFELDLNPLLGSLESVVAVDARIRILK